MTFFLAQTDPLSGGAGWVGAGLLGAVLAWLLLKHLPEKDRQIERIIDKHDATEAVLTATFKAEMSAERSSCEKHFASLAEAMSKGSESTLAAFKTLADQIQSHAERNQQWSDLLRAKHLEVQSALSVAHEAEKKSGGGTGGQS